MFIGSTNMKFLLWACLMYVSFARVSKWTFKIVAIV